jgi:hypothetical protein
MFLPYFQYLFTIQLSFLPYFPYLFTIQLTFNKAELILENQQTWREENFDLKEPLETMKKDMEYMEET